MKACPSCLKELDAAVTRCDCGYSFEGRFVEPKWPDEEVPDARRKPAFALPERGAQADGSLLMGVCLGFVCGCFGLAIAYFAKMGSETKRGALYGMLIGFGLGMVARVLYR